MNAGDLKRGDWVRPYSKGIWRVSRILTGFNEFRYRLSEPKVPSHRTLVFSNRLVNDAWKRSFASECSNATLVTKLSDDERQRVEELLRNPRLSTAFDKYESTPKPVDLIVNLRFGPMPQADRERFAHAMEEVLELPMRGGMTLDEVLECIRAAGFEDYSGKVPEVAGVQLVSPGHELRGSDFVMRHYRVRLPS